MYMDGTDYLHELGETETTIYHSIEALKSNRPCTEECGIVAVRVQLVEWVQKQDYSKYRD